MITTPVFIITIAIVVLLAAIATWLVRKSATAMQRQLQANNQDLRQQLQSATGKAEMLMAENTNIKAQHAAASESARMMRLRVDELNASVEALNGEIKALDEVKDALDRDKASLQARLDAVTRTREQLEEESRQTFKVIAADLLSHSRKTMNEEGKQGLNQLLTPLREQIDGLNKELKEYQNKQEINSQVFDKQLEKMMAANKEITQEASRLSNALVSNNKIQGDWGEGVLKRILDLSGLEQDIHYEMQVTRDDDGKVIRNDEGAMLRPDFALFMPDGKRLIIDSKVSLTAFVDYANATSPEEQEQALKQHLASVRAQVDLLAKKEYTTHVKNATDFALMFIPSEPAYLAAMQGNQQLWEYAYSKHVVIVSPTHLLSVAQLLMQLWSRDKQNKNAEAIAKEVTKLMDKVDAFNADLDRIQNGINAMQNTFDSAKRRLEGKGGIIAKSAKIKQLAGLKTPELNE
ncbi:MAG: DNA recombination protein RmuC [Muribaculaceae bacterium]|nr:DNA recombination protein RmuC [Muribaculaceae bacterium]